MNTPSWMIAERAPRKRVRRTAGRRASDKWSVESILFAGVVIAWAWGAYEIALLFLR